MQESRKIGIVFLVKMITEQEITDIDYQLPISEKEALVGITTVGIPVVVDEYTEDLADLAQLASVREKEAEIMRLAPELRNTAWCSLSPILANFSQNEATFKALEQLYTRDGVRFNGTIGVDDGGTAKTWFECYSNARAVRERKSITTKLLLEAASVAHSLNPDRSVELASIASGSARCIIEALQQKSSLIEIKARMLDWDEEARKYSIAMAKAAGVIDYMETIPGDVIKIKKYLAGRPVDIAEAVGIIDYLDDRTTVFFLRQIHDLLSPEGVVVASNILPNHESDFIHTAVGWRPMQYRTEDDFASLFVQAGFEPRKSKLHRIPLGIYSIVEAKK